MKKLLIALLLLPSIAWGGDLQIARMNPYILGAGTASIQYDSCTGSVASPNGGLLFSWHAENDVDVADGGVAGGVNGGCVVSGADGSAAANSGAAFSNAQAYDGTYSVSVPTAADYYSFTWANDTVNPNAGTVDFWIYITTFTNSQTYWKMTADANNYIQLSATTANDVQIKHTAGGTVRSATVDDALTTDSWHHVVAKWDTTVHGSDYLSLCVDATCTTVATALGTWDGTTGTMYWGDVGNWGGVYFLDTMKIYDSWK